MRSGVVQTNHSRVAYEHGNILTLKENQVAWRTDITLAEWSTFTQLTGLGQIPFWEAYMTPGL